MEEVDTTEEILPCYSNVVGGIGKQTNPATLHKERDGEEQGIQRYEKFIQCLSI
jgi:hypothetical protein